MSQGLFSLYWDWHFAEICQMIKRQGARAASILAFGLLTGLSTLGLSGPSMAGPADATSDSAAVAAPADPADAQAAPASQPAGTNQLSDGDRAAPQDDVRQPVIVTQQAETQTPTQAPPAAPIVAGSRSATWDETSLIGKIFIGFGALLTIASAARMFMA
jgi:hypothetical protein